MMNLASELQVSHWLNTDQPITLQGLRGKVVFIEAFQMLCPACVSHGLPQAVRAYQHFRADEVAVIGLHTVFEHRDAQGSEGALRAFLHEYRIPFPVGIDEPDATGDLPKTMTQYRMQGTPTQLLIDKQGFLRQHHFGLTDDLALGHNIASLIAEQAPLPPPSGRHVASGVKQEGDCDSEGCRIGGNPR